MDQNLMFSFDEIMVEEWIRIDSIENEQTRALNVINYQSKEIENFHSDFELLKEKVEAWLSHKKTILFCLSRDNQIKEIHDLFERSQFVKDELFENGINILKKKVNKGFIVDDLVLISEFDIEEVRMENIKYHNVLKIGKRIHSIDHLTLGDYVVHRSHGIGIYNGVVIRFIFQLKRFLVFINILIKKE